MNHATHEQFAVFVRMAHRGNIVYIDGQRREWINRIGRTTIVLGTDAAAASLLILSCLIAA